jgi:hypothetical protein
MKLLTLANLQGRERVVASKIEAPLTHLLSNIVFSSLSLSVRLHLLDLVPLLLNLIFDASKKAIIY